MAVNVEEGLAAARATTVIPSILEVICQTTGLGWAAVACVTPERWVAAAVHDRLSFGLKPGDELPIEATFCDRVRASRREVIFDDGFTDPEFSDHPVTRTYGLGSYISVPIILADGAFFGTLCALDKRPARLKDGPVLPMFRLFAQLLARHIDDRLLAEESHIALARLREEGELREQFIAVLGHDLRNPIAAIQSGVRLLEREPQSPRAQTLLGLMRQTTGRMSTLVDHLLDLARTRADGGFEIHRDATRCFAETFHQVVEEARTAYPEHAFEIRCAPDLNMPVDHDRMAQLLSNLLGNAALHGDGATPIRAHVDTDESGLTIRIANGGTPIPVEALGRLFQPFFRASEGGSKGLGLGLYIAAQIAQAHGGRIDVTSDTEATVFTVRLPASEQARIAAQ